MGRDETPSGALSVPKYARKQPLSAAAIARAIDMPWVQMNWRQMIASDRLKVLRGRDSETAVHHEHRYVGGPPPKRIKRIQLAQEARARKMDAHWDTVDLVDVYVHHNGICGICRMPVEFDEFTIDHIIPMSAGGSHLFENLQPAHAHCNSAKGDR